MSLFTKSDGTIANKDSYETGSFKLVPEGTKCLVNVMSCQRKENSTRRPKYDQEGANYLEIALVVVDGEFRNATCGHKLFIEAQEGDILDKAIDQIMVYEKLSKGKLQAVAKNAKHLSDVSDRQFSQAFNGLGLTATFGVWEMEGSDGVTRSGNFIRGIAPPSKVVQMEDKMIEAKAQDYEDDIPF